MPDSVRTQILKKVKTRLEALTGVGRVASPGTSEDGETDILQGGEYVLYLVVLDDEPIRPAASIIDGFLLRIVVVGKLPPASYSENKPPELAADELHWAIYGTYATADLGGWDNLAIKTECLGGGGVEFEQGGTLTPVMAHAMEIHYRIRRGEPTVAT